VYQLNLSQRSLRSALLLGAASAFAVGMAAPAAADTVETVVVTGSLIPSPNATSNSPIQTVGAEAIDLSGHPDVGQIVNQLPQIVPGLGAFSNNPGGGETVLDLRGLSPNRTLVLVDGRRAMAASPSGEVDLNTIPAALVDHVDVVSGGGSATYGSDAISGVVNFVLKKDFEGFQAQARYGEEVEHSFAPEKALNVMMGVNTADGKGNVTMFAEWYKRSEVTQGQDPRFLLDLGEGSSTSPAGRVDAGQGFPALSKNGVGNCAGASSTYAFQPNGNPEGFCSALPPTGNAFADALGNSNRSFDELALGGLNPEGDRYNFAPFNDLVTPDRRVSFQANGHYDIFPGIEAFGSLHYVNNVNQNQLAPSPVTSLPGQIFDATPRAACAGIGTVPGNGNALCDANLGATGLTSYITPAFQGDIDARATTINPGTGLAYGYSPFVVRFRSNAVGARLATFTTDEYQLTGGLRGQFGKMFGGWDWETYYDVGRTESYDTSTNNVLTSRLFDAMLSCPAGSAGNPVSGVNCVPVDIFGVGNLTPAQAAYIGYTTHDVTTYNRQVVHGETHGDLFDLPAGPVAAALGAEYRKDDVVFDPDQAKQNFDIEGFNGSKATRGGFDVSEAFGEIKIPLLSDMDFVQYLGLDAGYRFSQYSNAGSASTWKAGGEWQPLDDIRFRTMWQRALRAPNVNDLFNGGAQGFPGVTDPCAGAALLHPVTAVDAACKTWFAQTGAAGAEVDGYQQVNGQYESVAYGNPNLKPEVSNTFTVGTVITPSFLPGVTASVDYYHIAIHNFIGSAYGGSQSVADTCLASIEAGNPIGSFVGIGDNSVPTTFPNSCRFTTRLPDGEMAFDLPNSNSGDVHTGGIDLQVSAQHDLADLFGDSGDWGSVDLNFTASFLTQYFDSTGGCGGAGNPGGIPGEPGACSIKGHVDFFGQAVFSTADIRPNFKSGLHLGYTIDDWRFMFSWNHISAVTDPFGTGINLPEYDTFDLATRWNFSENYSLDLTINNLFDKHPPLGPYSLLGGINTIAEAYDVLGRQASIAITAKL
jgi:outer membrane receptor protein involved in Fe transport